MENASHNTFALTAKQLLFVSLYWAVIMPVAVFVAGVPLWLTVPIVLFGIIGLIGIVLASLCSISSSNMLEYVVYAVSLGSAFALVGGLLMNWLLPLIGIAHPLAALPMAVFFDSAMVILAAGNYLYKKDHSFAMSFSSASITSWLLAGIAPLFALLAWFGAERLNNGGNNTLTMVMLAGIALYVIALAYWNKAVRQWVYVVALYCISLSLLLMFSLRSGHIIGWDINQEYEVFQTTLQHLVWHASYYVGLDYNACLSITILPTIFAQLTHVPAEYVFKAVFQLLFAFSPVMVFAFARRYLNDIMAFMAAFLLLSQTWFFEQMPGLIRQETAFIFFMALLLALLDDHLKKTARSIVLSVSVIGIILSHYSTAYIAIIALVVMLVISYAARFIAPFKKERVLFKPVIMIGTVIALIIWQAPVTHTIGKFIRFATNDNQTIVAPSSFAGNAFTAQDPVEIPIPVTPVPRTSLWQEAAHTAKTIFFIPSQTGTDSTVMEAQQAAHAIYSVQPGYHFYPTAISDRYNPASVSTTAHMQEALPHILSVVLIVLEKIVKLVMIDIFPLIGIAVLYAAYRKNQSAKTYRMIILGIGGCLLIAVMIAVPYIQEYYNFTRLFLQMFLFLSTFAITGAIAALKRLNHSHLWLAGLLAIVFLSSTGFLDQLTGGPARLTLNQPPSTMDSLYIHDAEIAGAQWLLTRNYDDPVEADAEGNLRLESFAGMSSGNTALFPATINPQGYVYATTANLTRKTATYQYQNNLLTFDYPEEFLQDNKNLIYNSGGSEIYH